MYKTIRFYILPALIIAFAAFSPVEAQPPGADKVPAKPNENILDIQYKNPVYNTSDPSWAKSLCSNGIWLKSGASPRFEWMPILNPQSPVEEKTVAVTGRAINAHLSKDDVWFTHPFENDFNFDVVWKSNPNYDYLAAPKFRSSDENTNKEEELLGQQVLNAGVENPKSIHVEMDADFVPRYFRPSADGSDSVAVFGRWVVDCGHDNYQSEIHPPLMFVKAAAGNDGESTRSTVISRPFLVTQEFDGKSLYDHLIKQAGILAAKGLAPPFPGIWTINDQITARPGVLTVPFTGLHWFVYFVRPPIKGPPNKRLSVSYHFTVRTGVTVQLSNVGDAAGTVMVHVVFNDANYKPAALPPKTNRKVTLDEIKKHQNLGPYIEGAQAGAALLGNPFVAHVLQKGVDTDDYLFPTIVDPPNKIVFANNLPVNTPVTIDDSQPFPIRGTVEVKWVADIRTIPAERQATPPKNKVIPKIIRPPR